MSELFERIGDNLAGRITGPFALRLLLQPTVAGILGIIILDIVYQLMVLRYVYPGEALGGRFSPGRRAICNSARPAQSRSQAMAAHSIDQTGPASD